jgi:hypothetical protein
MSALAITALVALPARSYAGPQRDDGSSRSGSHNPGILRPAGRAFGLSYGEWAERYWQWVLAQPTPTNPQLDATGEFAGVGQSGPLWFLASTFGNSAERNITIPSGKALFFAVQPWIFGAGTFDCEPTVPGVPCDVPTLHAAAAVATDGSSVVEASIDGVPVNDASSYRAADEGSFSITVPADNPIGISAGTYAPQVVDGYWLLIAPLTVGPHTITSHIVSNQFGGFEFTLTDHITVVPAQGLSATLSTDEFWKRAGADVAPAPVVKRTSWGGVKAIYR